MKRRHALSMWVVIFTLALLVTGGQAQGAQDAYPNKTIRLILGMAPGGAMETAARLWMPSLEKELGVPIRLDTMPGAEGIIGGRVAAAAEPDGYTLIQKPLSFLPAQVMIFKAPYGIDAFEIISNYITDPLVLLVHKESPWKTLKELVEFAKANPPGTLSFGQSSLTAPGALSLYALEEALNIKLNVVSFSGGGPARNALAGKHINASLTGLYSGRPISQFVRVLGVAQDKNLWVKDTDNAPTINDALGIKIPSVADSISLFAPAGFSKKYPERFKTFSDAFFKVMNSPEFKERIEKTGDAGRFLPRSKEESERLLQADIALYKKYMHVFKDYQLKK